MGSKQPKLQKSWSYLIGTSNSRYPGRDKRHLKLCTIIIGAIRIQLSDLDDLSGRERINDMMIAMVDGFRRDWLGLVRGRHLTGYTWRGAFEIDVRRSLRPGSHCRETIASMGYDASPLGQDERIIVVHVHFLMDGLGVISDDDLNGEIWADQVRRSFRRSWLGRRQHQVKGLYDHQSASEAIHGICTYIHKQRLSYTTGGYGDQPSKVVGPYEQRLSQLARMFYGSDVVFRSKR